MSAVVLKLGQTLEHAQGPAGQIDRCLTNHTICIKLTVQQGRNTLRVPWEFHNDLSLDRLQQIGKVLRDVREGAIRLHDPAGGDSRWSLGVRIYARSCEILQRTGSELWEWFNVVSEPLEFVFTVGSVPLRFCHDDPDRIGANHLRVSDFEGQQIEIAFGDNAADLIWRIVVETSAGGDTKQITLIGAKPTGEVHCKFIIPPLQDSLSFFTTPLRPRTGPGVSLPSPVVRLKNQVIKKEADEDRDV